MKTIRHALLFIAFIQFLSGCSQGYRSNAYNTQLAQQQAIAKQHQAQVGAKQRAQNTAYRRIPRPSYQPRNNPKSMHTSQQAHSSAVLTQHPARNLMAKIARSTIGMPYKWGGNNPRQGFDCSGLMRYVHKHALGMTIPRTAAKQRDASRTIDYNQLQPGDMLFFKTGRNANHVGVYVGNRKFVHAASGSKHVKIASMDSAYWHSRFVKFGTFL